MKVRHVLYFVVSVIVLLAILMFIFPKEGIRINKNWVLHFPSFDEMFLSSKNKKIDADSLINSQIDINELMPETEIDLIDNIDFAELKKSVTPLEFPENNPYVLDVFYSKLHNINKIGRASCRERV